VKLSVDDPKSPKMLGTDPWTVTVMVGTTARAAQGVASTHAGACTVCTLVTVT